MENNEAKKYLESLQNEDKTIRNLKQKIACFRSEVSSPKGLSYDSDYVQTSGNKDSMADKIVKYTDMETALNECKLQLAIDRHKIINQIQEIENTYYMVLLYEKYVNYKDLKQISREMGLAYNYVRKIHPLALREFADRWMQ